MSRTDDNETMDRLKSWMVREKESNAEGEREREMLSPLGGQPGDD